jgi:hypothetical protein
VTEDEKTEKVRLAVKYYYLPLRSVLISDPTYQTVQAVVSEVLSDLGFEKDANYDTHRSFIIQALADFYRLGLCDLISDDFADQFVRSNAKTAEHIPQDDFKKIEERFLSLGDSGHEWLASALSRISKQFKPEDLKLLKQKRPNKDSSAETQEPTEKRTASELDQWEPIKLDRKSSKFEEAVGAAEAALREIEGSNGYASSEPEERNGLVATVKGSIEALKEGTPSRQSIVYGLIKPLEYIVKKFTDSTMGEIAKIAVAKLTALLFS